MRIVYVSFWFYDYTIRMANEVSKTDDVVIFLPNDIPNIYLEDVSKNIRLELFNNPSLFSVKSFFTILDIAQKVSKYKPDLVHFQMLNPLVLPIILMLKKFPIVVTYHDAVPHPGEGSFFSRYVFQFVALLSDSIIVHGNQIKKVFTSHYLVNSKKVFVLKLGRHEIDLFKKFESPYVKEEDNTVLFFGRIKDYKGLDYLINSEPYVRKAVPNMKFLIAGKGELKQSIKNKNIQLENRYIGYEEGAQLFQRCSVIVTPYIEASQSGIVPVAYGFCKPIVSTDVGSLNEIIDHEKTGLIIPPRNSYKLAEALIRLLKDQNLRHKLGLAGFKKLNNELSWNVIKKDLFAIYYSTLKNHE